MKIKEVQIKSVLSKSSILDYSVNCYTGCENGCQYCYARFMQRPSVRKENWGKFVDVKINAPKILAKELKNTVRGKKVILSSMCDGWQPIEEKYQLTRKCLKLLLEANLKVVILTKSNLIERDFDLMKQKQVELGVAITSLDEGLAKIIEPDSASVSDRLKILKKAGKLGIKNWLFLGPLLPELSDSQKNLRQFFEKLARINPNYILIDKLNIKYKIWQSLKKMIMKHFPYLKEKYSEIFFTPAGNYRYVAYLRNLVENTAKEFKLSNRTRMMF